MVSIRRILVRLLRWKTILCLTVIVILLYIVKHLDYQVLTPNPTVMKLRRNSDAFVPSSLKKIDWHDKAMILEESKRIGIGEQGAPASLPPGYTELEKQLYSVNGFNGALSDLIALNRSLPDIRHKKCQTMRYIESLPTVSVVVPFHNEHLSTLLRTAHSVINRSPKHILQEIILVDDASTKEFLKKDLEDYLKKNIPKARVLRLHDRNGLITARLAGARQVTGDVIVFLDSHTEANVNWLPPLLEPIALNPRVVTCPFIDVVSFESLEYRAQDEGARGAFDWELYYKRLPVLPADAQKMPEPFASPVMAGGLFAISAMFFWELGGYDPGLDIWGGEQYELSFKIWQCGGAMLDVPCSRVGHVYRKFAPFPNPGRGDFVGRNYRRVAEVWMDEYAQFLYKRRPHYLLIDTGDITEQKALRKKLKCKSFKWFMTQVAFDLPAKYPMVEPEPFAEGRIRPENNPKLCVDAHNGDQMDKYHIKPCTPNNQEQQFVFTMHRDVKTKSRNMCFDLPDANEKSPIVIYGCHLGGGNQLWRYATETKQITHGDYNCLDYDVTSRDLYVNTCDENAASQRWTIDKLNMDMIHKWHSYSKQITGPVEKVDE